MRGIAGSILATISNENAGTEFICTHVAKELSALCPRTRIADFYELCIEYIPSTSLVELKSLRDYLATFRDVEVFHEPLMNRIFNDFVEAVEPVWIRVVLTANVRGGIVSKIARVSGSPPNRSQATLESVPA